MGVIIARLFLIDPMWIANEPTDTDNIIKKLRNGNIRTVTLQLAKKRIEFFTKPLSKEMFNQFIKICRHKNRVIQFFHDDLSKEEENKKENIICELRVTWHFLYKLLRQEWSDYFSKCLGGILEFSTLFRKNNEKFFASRYFSTVHKIC